MDELRPAGAASAVLSGRDRLVMCKLAGHHVWFFDDIICRECGAEIAETWCITCAPHPIYCPECGEIANNARQQERKTT